MTQLNYTAADFPFSWDRAAPVSGTQKLLSVLLFTTISDLTEVHVPASFFSGNEIKPSILRIVNCLVNIQSVNCLSIFPNSTRAEMQKEGRKIDSCNGKITCCVH